MPRTAAEGAAASMGRVYGAGRRSLSSGVRARYLTNADAQFEAQHYHTRVAHTPVGVRNETSLLKTRHDSKLADTHQTLTHRLGGAAQFHAHLELHRAVVRAPQRHTGLFQRQIRGLKTTRAPQHECCGARAFSARR